MEGKNKDLFTESIQLFIFFLGRGVGSSVRAADKRIR